MSEAAQSFEKVWEGEKEGGIFRSGDKLCAGVLWASVADSLPAKA